MFGTRKTEVLNSLIINITAKANDTTDILQTFRQLLLSSSVHSKRECWSLTMTSKKSALLCILIMSSDLQNCLNTPWSNPSYWLIIVIAYHVYTF